MQLRTRGLAPRSIAIALAAWRGLYAWWGRNGRVAVNPVLGVRPPKAARPLPKALPVEQAVALATQQDATGDPVLDARDHAITELLYGSGLRVAELMGLDLAPSATARGWLDLQALQGLRVQRQCACGQPAFHRQMLHEGLQLGCQFVGGHGRVQAGSRRLSAAPATSPMRARNSVPMSAA